MVIVMKPLTLLLPLLLACTPISIRTDWQAYPRYPELQTRTVKIYQSGRVKVTDWERTDWPDSIELIPQGYRIVVFVGDELAGTWRIDR